MPTEASAFVERCNPGLILPVFRPDKEFSGRHPIGKLAHVHAVFCPVLAGLAAILLLLEIFHRISRSEAHTSELQSLMRISSAVFCLITHHLFYNPLYPSPTQSSYNLSLLSSHLYP